MVMLSNGVTVGFYDLVNNGIANLSKDIVTRQFPISSLIL